jgi:hypothetical protein
VLACAEPSEDETPAWPLSSDVLFESLLLEPVLLDVLESWLLEPLVVLDVVDELSVEVAVDVSFTDWVASRAAKPKPAVAATAVTARPADTATARRLPCSRDVMCSSFDGVH